MVPKLHVLLTSGLLPVVLVAMVPPPTTSMTQRSRLKAQNAAPDSTQILPLTGPAKSVQLDTHVQRLMMAPEDGQSFIVMVSLSITTTAIAQLDLLTTIIH